MRRRTSIVPGGTQRGSKRNPIRNIRSLLEMPEGDTIYRAAGVLHNALRGRTVEAFASVLPNLTRVDCDSPLAGAHH